MVFILSIMSLFIDSYAIMLAWNMVLPIFGVMEITFPLALMLDQLVGVFFIGMLMPIYMRYIEKPESTLETLTKVLCKWMIMYVAVGTIYIASRFLG